MRFRFPRREFLLVQLGMGAVAAAAPASSFPGDAASAANRSIPFAETTHRSLPLLLPIAIAKIQSRSKTVRITNGRRWAVALSIESVGSRR